MLLGEQEPESWEQRNRRQWNEKSGPYARPEGLLEMAGFVPALGVAKVASPGVAIALSKLRKMVKELDLLDETANLDEPISNAAAKGYNQLRAQMNSIWRGLPKREQDIVSLGQKLRKAQRVKPEWMPDENIMEPPQANPDWLDSKQLEELGRKLMGLKKSSPYYK